MTGLAPEVKAQSALNLAGWLKQARRNAGDDVPFVVHRLNGTGPASMANWAVIMRLEDFTALIRWAGYGEPPLSDGEPEEDHVCTCAARQLRQRSA